MKPDGTGIIYLCKDRISLYCNLLPAILEGKFSKRAVKDMMILDEQHFTDEVTEFLTKYRVPKSKLILVLADEAAMIKEFTTAVINQHEVNSFLQYVPYQEKVTKTIQTDDGLTIYVANQHILKMLKSAVEQVGFTIESVLPAAVFSPELGKQQKLSQEMCSEIFAKTLSLHEYNLLPPPVPQGMIRGTYPATPEERAQRRHDILRLYAYTTIFGLLVIAIVVVWNVQNPGPSQTYRGRASQPAPTLAIASPSATLTPLPAKQRIKIINYSGNVDLAKKLQSQLVQDKFTNVTIENKPVSPTAKSTIIYSDKISQDVRDVIFKDVKTYQQQISVQVTVNAQTPITVILGK